METLKQVHAALESFKGYTKRERIAMAEESACLEARRNAAKADHMRAHNLKSDEEYEAWLFGDAYLAK